MNITFYLCTKVVNCVIQSLLLSYILNKNGALPPATFFVVLRPIVYYMGCVRKLCLKSVELFSILYRMFEYL